MQHVELYGIETWPMKMESEVKFNSTEMHIIRWISEFTVEERKTSASLKSCLDWSRTSQLVIEKVD